MSSKSFGSEKAVKPHLLQQTGGLAAEILDLRRDVEDAFVVSDAKAGFPEILWVDGGAPSAAGGSMVIKGLNLLQGQTFDSYSWTQSAVALTLAAVKPGDSGLAFEVIAGSGALSVSYADKVLTITLASGGSTANAVATAINALAGAKGIIRANVTGAGTFTAAVAETPLAGGVGDWDNNTITVSGVEAKPAHATGTATVANWSDTVITVTVPDLTAETDARAAGDLVAIQVKSNNIRSNTVVAALGA